jgi:hypothetical protein
MATTTRPTTGTRGALTPLSVDGMIVAASTTLLAESRSGGRGGFLPWALLAAGSVASLAANVAVAEPTATGRMIAAWPSFALIASYELLMRQVRRATYAGPRSSRSDPGRASLPSVVVQGGVFGAAGGEQPTASTPAGREHSRRQAGRDAQAFAWQWALDNRSADGSLPSGKDIGRQYHRHERWGRLVKNAGLAGKLDSWP